MTEKSDNSPGESFSNYASALAALMGAVAAGFGIYLSIVQNAQNETIDSIKNQIEQDKAALEQQVTQSEFLNHLLDRIEKYLNQRHGEQPGRVIGGSATPIDYGLDDNDRLRIHFTLSQIAVESHIAQDRIMRERERERKTQNGASTPKAWGQEQQAIDEQYDLLRAVPLRLALLSDDDGTLLALHRGTFSTQKIRLWADLALHTGDVKLRETVAKALATIGESEQAEDVVLQADLLRRLNDIVQETMLAARTADGESTGSESRLAIDHSLRLVVSELARLRDAIASSHEPGPADRATCILPQGVELVPTTDESAATPGALAVAPSSYETPQNGMPRDPETGDPAPQQDETKQPTAACSDLSAQWTIARGLLKHNAALLSSRQPVVADMRPGTSYSDAPTQYQKGTATDSKQAPDDCAALSSPALADQITSLISSLQSNDSSLRRSARTRLAEIGPTAVVPMMAAFREPGPTYRTRLGVLVALNEMLPEDFGRKIRAGKCVRTQLTPDDIQAIVDAIGVEDRTMRQYATEFLYDLDDPRAVLPLTQLAASSSSTSIASTYQAVFAIGDAIADSDLKSEDKTKAIKILTELRDALQGSKQPAQYRQTIERINKVL